MACEGFGITGYTPALMSTKDIYNEDGLVVWEKLANIGLKGLRVRNYSKADVDKALEDEKNQVILQVKTKFGPHWVLIVGSAADGGYLINDPLDGKKKTSSAYSAITGYTILSKDEKKNSEPTPVNTDQIPSEYARQAVEKAKREGRTTGVDPHRVATPQEMVKFFYKYGLFKSEGGALTRERVIYALEEMWERLKNTAGQMASANPIPGQKVN